MVVEMIYIEESQLWTCPMAGRWKVIAVGGGASAYFVNTINNMTAATTYWSASGGTTSFGSVISAEGGENGHREFISRNTGYRKGDGGYGGYNGYDYGGNTSSYNNGGEIGRTGNGGLQGFAGDGWGAGGGAWDGKLLYMTNETESRELGVNFLVSGGKNGGIKTSIVQLDEGEQIPCTIGKGGLKGGITEEQAIDFIVNAYKTNNFLLITPEERTAFDTLNSPGRDGVIVLQYLGGI